MDVYEAVTKRRSIRKFKDTPIPYDILEKCVNAARLAPTGKNRQLLEFMIIDDEQLLPRILDTVGSWAGQPKPAGGWSPEGKPKAYIFLMVNTPLEAEIGGTRSVTTCDVGMAAENMMLVALAEGIGSCPILSFKEEELRPLLNIPDKYQIALELALGFPDESPVTEVAADPVKSWLDSAGVRHIPKRELKDVCHRNRFP